MALLDIIREIHIGCFQLCKQALGKYLPVAGNVGIFSQSESEHDLLTKIREEMTLPSNNPNQKYFQLKQPVIVPAIGDIPETTYTHLYIRRPAVDSPQRGDVDFVLPKEQYVALKEQILKGDEIRGAGIYDRPGWDNIELRDSKINALGYISTQEMAEKIRVKF